MNMFAPAPPMENGVWSDRLAFDIALALEGSGENINDILQKHNIDLLSLLDIRKDPLFSRKVSDYRKDISDNGTTFRLKARTQAEELLTTSWMLIHGQEVSAAVKADLIKSTMKWAGYDSVADVSGGDGPAGGVSININFAGQNHEVTLKDATTKTIESDAGD